MRLLIKQKMLRHTKNSDQINPWTFRQRETSRQFNDSTNKAYKPIKSLREKLTLNKKSVHTEPYTHMGINGISVNDIIHEQQSRIVCGKIHTYSIEHETFGSLEKTMPSYKVINFQYGFRPSNRATNRKKLPNYVSNSMRQYTQGMQLVAKKQDKPASQYQKILKVRRYFTEQKDYEDYSERKFTQNHNLTEMSKTEQVRKPLERVVKIVRTSKHNLREEVVTKGRLYEKIQDICERKGISGGGHLSTMKRNYNIKKLQKLLNQTQN